MSKRNHWLPSIVALLVWLTPMIGEAASPEIEDARNSVVEGRTLYNQGEYQKALDHFTKAWTVIKLPSTALSVARAKERLGRLTEAASMYREAAALTPSPDWPKEPHNFRAQQQAQNDAQVELKALLPRIPTVQVQVNGLEPSEVTLTIDGAAIESDDAVKAREINPGQHTVVARSKDGRESTKVVTVQEGNHENVAIDFATAQASTSQPIVASATPLAATVTPPRGHITPQKPIASQSAHTPLSGSALPWIGVGIGSAGLIFGTLTGIVAYSKLKEADCGSDNRCPSEVYDGQGKNYNSWRTASTVGFIVGGAGAALAGVTWLITRPEKEGSAQIGVAVGPGSWAVEGKF